MIRSQSMCLQIPLNAEWMRSLAVSPFLSSSSTCSSVPESCPDYQRVTISGDYCAGVSRSNKITIHAELINELQKKREIYLKINVRLLLI